MNCRCCGCATTQGTSLCPLCGAELSGRDEQTIEAGCGSSTIDILAPAVAVSADGQDAGAHFRYAGFWIRFCALMFDGLVLVGISAFVYALCLGIVGSFSPGTDTTTGAFFLPQLMANGLIKAAYFIYFHAVTGQTIGKKALGLKVVRRDGNLLGWPASALRYIGAFFSAIIFGLGYIRVAFDPKKQGWHDKLAGSFVIRT